MVKIFLLFNFKNIGKYEIQYIFNSNLTNINHLFFKYSSLITLDLSNYSTQNVTNMSNMFYGCQSLIKINLSNINTYNVVNMNSMFGECSSLIDLDLSNFNTLNIIDISKMFYKCSSLINIDLSNFNINNATKMNQIFYECSSLIYLDLSNFHINYCVGKKDMFYNCSSLIKNNKKRKITIFINGYPIIKEHFFNITDSIGDIKKYVQELTDFPFSSQRLVYAGMEMTNDRILEDINKDTYSFIFYLVRYLPNSTNFPEEIKFKIEEENKIIKINTNLITTIYEIKQQIFKQANLSPVNIIYKGAILEDYKTILSIKNKSTINLSKNELKFITIYLYNADKKHFLLLYW